MIGAAQLLAGYARGVFPMAESGDDPNLYWFDPPMRGINLLLWFAAPVAALLGLILAFVFLRGRSRAASSIRDLNEAERARLDEIMHE